MGIAVAVCLTCFRCGGCSCCRILGVRFAGSAEFRLTVGARVVVWLVEDRTVIVYVLPYEWSVGLGVGTVCCAGGRMVPVRVLWYRRSVGPAGAGRCVPGVWPK